MREGSPFKVKQIINGEFNRAQGCSLTRFEVPANLDMAPEHAVTTTQLANLLIASKGNITRLLDRMEDGGASFAPGCIWVGFGAGF